MASEPKITVQALKVIRTLLDADGGELSGAEIGRTTSLQSGTLYPLLARLEDAGWLGSRWEEGDPATMKRPRRRYYKVTGLGQTRYRAEMNGLQALDPRMGWGWAKA